MLNRSCTRMSAASCIFSGERLRCIGWNIINGTAQLTSTRYSHRLLELQQVSIAISCLARGVLCSQSVSMRRLRNISSESRRGVSLCSTRRRAHHILMHNTPLVHFNSIWFLMWSAILTMARFSDSQIPFRSCDVLSAIFSSVNHGYLDFLLYL